ncbi:hypothetical protein [Flavobacterium proteolyticum]|uniref:Uncharacterized protein n=1 Tax=Flavobacterium proteolyticum TaxID=2911683 RepID=A0ABR9WV85_9FLAO|nr:hypothetical protein [Flavobacterium proteolyticum]MBE9577579.1 hypothetical protein [Flavobacterium proteolyticum]
MKKTTKIFVFAGMLITATVSAQVGIGTTTPSSSSILELESTSKGLRLPRMTTAQRTAIASPVSALQVFDTTTNSIWIYNGTTWTEVGAGGATSNIYTADGQLTAARVVNQNNNSLTFQTGTAKTVVDGNFQTTGLLYAKAPRVHPIAASITWQADDVVILLQSTHSGNIVFPSASANPNRLVGINNRSGSARLITDVTGGDTGVYANEAVSQIASGSGVSWWISDGISWRLYSGRP